MDSHVVFSHEQSGFRISNLDVFYFSCLIALTKISCPVMGKKFWFLYIQSLICVFNMYDFIRLWCISVADLFRDFILENR